MRLDLCFSRADYGLGLALSNAGLVKGVEKVGDIASDDIDSQSLHIARAARARRASR